MFRKFFQELFKIILLIIILFYLINLVPGNVAQIKQGLLVNSFDKNLAQSLHLNDPLYKQLGFYLNNLLHGNFGTSFINEVSVIKLIKTSLPITLFLSLLSFFFSLFLGTSLGFYAALKSTSFTTKVIDFFSSLLLCLPSFVIGILLIQIFILKYALFPLYEKLSFSNFVLPALSISLTSGSFLYKMMKTQTQNTLKLHFIQNARLRPLTNTHYYFSYILKNTFFPIFNLASLELSLIIGGTFIIESLFGLPGLGKLLISSITHKDTPVVLGVVIITAILISFISFITESIKTFFFKKT
jgi:ABC-type dipeptide/oligopeptide/nickel transport system permease component